MKYKITSKKKRQANRLQVLGLNVDLEMIFPTEESTCIHGIRMH